MHSPLQAISLTSLSCICESAATISWALRIWVIWSFWGFFDDIGKASYLVAVPVRGDEGELSVDGIVDEELCDRMRFTNDRDSTPGIGFVFLTWVEDSDFCGGLGHSLCFSSLCLCLCMRRIASALTLLPLGTSLAGMERTSSAILASSSSVQPLPVFGFSHMLVYPDLLLASVSN